MPNQDFDWDPPSISSDDQRLVDAYVRTGVPLDGLVYTEKFKELAQALTVDSNDDRQLRDLYLRLLALRKRSMLPRLYDTATSTSNDH